MSQNFSLAFNRPALSKLIRNKSVNRNQTLDQQYIHLLQNKKNCPLKSKSIANTNIYTDGFPGINFSTIANENQELAKTLYGKGNFHIQQLETINPLAIGLGLSSIYETSIQLHHVYGFPYVPASSFKGAVRSWVIYRYFDNDEMTAFKDEGFCNIFGDSSEIVTSNHPNLGRGKVIFWDLFPKDHPELCLEILNTHYGNYYSGKGEPVDSDAVIPINFLTVANGVRFQMILGVKNNIPINGIFTNEFHLFNNQTAVPNLLEVSLSLVKEALTTWGVGAKTALGYGKMKFID